MANEARRLLGSLWVLAGVGLSAWAVAGLDSWSKSVERFQGPRDTLLLFGGFGFAAAVGGGLVISGARAGLWITLILSSLASLYAAAFFLFGGRDDTSTTYALCVLGLLAIAAATFAARRRLGSEARRPE